MNESFENHEQQREAGAKSGIVRGTSKHLSDVFSSDLDSLMRDITSGTICGVSLTESTVQTILERAASAALESAIRNEANLREISLRHQQRMELEELKHKNRLSAKSCVSDRESDREHDSSSDSMTIAELMAKEGSAEQAESSALLPRPPADQTFGDYYESLSRRHKRTVLGWFENENELIAASEMAARYVYDNFK